MDRSSFSSCVFTLFLDSCIYRRCFSQYLPQQMSRHLYLSRITEDLYRCSSRSSSHFLNLSRSIRTYSPSKHTLLTPNLQPTWFLAFPCSNHLVWSIFSLILHAFHVLKPRFLGFWKILGFFKIDELLLKIFRLGYAYVILKLHALHSMCIITVFSCI